MEPTLPRTIACALLIPLLSQCSREVDETGGAASISSPSGAGGAGAGPAGVDHVSGGGDVIDAQPQDGAKDDLPSVHTELPYDFDEWHEDFPYSLHVPPRKAGQWYGRNSQEAIEKIVANLSGLCTKPAWLMSKEFFDRHWDEAADVLIEKLDETQRRGDLYVHAENILNVMARATGPTFARVLERAAAHPYPGVRRATFRALYGAADEAAVMKIGKQFARMGRAEQVDWVKAAARHLDDEKLFELFRELLTKTQFAHLQATAFEAVSKLKPGRAARLCEPIWTDLPEDLQLHVAGFFHAIGDGRGTVRLRHALGRPVKDVMRTVVAVQGVMRGKVEPLVDELLALTNEDHEMLNLLLIGSIMNVPGQPVTDTLVTMTDHRRSYQVRQLSLRALIERGAVSEAEELLNFVRKGAAGGRYNEAVADLVGARYGKVAPVLLARSKKEARSREIFFVRMIARLNHRDAFPPLKEIFLRKEERYVGWQRGRRTNVTFLGVQFSNLLVAVDDVIALLDQLPRKEYRRRAALIHCLANTAGANPTLPVSAKVYEVLRKRVFDSGEMPQIRILALDYLRKNVRLADAMKLKRRLRKEHKGMQQYLSDYLLEFF